MQEKDDHHADALLALIISAATEYHGPHGTTAFWAESIDVRNKETQVYEENFFESDYAVEDHLVEQKPGTSNDIKLKQIMTEELLRDHLRDPLCSEICRTLKGRG